MALELELDQRYGQEHSLSQFTYTTNLTYEWKSLLNIHPTIHSIHLIIYVTSGLKHLAISKLISGFYHSKLSEGTFKDKNKTKE